MSILFEASARNFRKNLKHPLLEGAVAMPKRPQYASDLTAMQWEIIRKLLPKPAVRGRKPIDRREILNAILYVV